MDKRLSVFLESTRLVENFAVKVFFDSICIHVGERFAQKNKETFIYLEPQYLYKPNFNFWQDFFSNGLGQTIFG
jgi:hypothetical protein